MASSRFPSLPISQVTIPWTPLIEAAYGYAQEHSSSATFNHCLRSTAFSLLLVRKFPPLAAAASLDTESLVLSVLLHDMGWATTKTLTLLSADKRFEVDGANIAREFIKSNTNTNNTNRQCEGQTPWDKHRLQLVWDAIALHTTPSIAHHKEPEVFATQLGILADFLGPNIPLGEPGSLITVGEYKEIVTAFPRLGFKDQVVDILCGLCRDKPATTFDNFVSDYAKIYGLDGKGSGKDEWRKTCDENSTASFLINGLATCAQWDG